MFRHVLPSPWGSSGGAASRLNELQKRINDGVSAELCGRGAVVVAIADADDRATSGARALDVGIRVADEEGVAYRNVQLTAGVQGGRSVGFVDRQGVAPDDHAEELRQPERIEHLVRTVFDHLQANRDLPRFMIQLLAGSRPLPPVMAEMLRANHALVMEIIAAGQADGTIRSGNPRLMALSIVAQPIWLTIVRDLLQQAIGLDQDDRYTRAEIVDNAVRFIRAGLAPLGEDS